MPTERHNEMTDWRTRVGDLDGLTSEPVFNSAHTWNKLQSRLDNKKRHISSYWYWAAAAFLILMMTIPAIKMNNRESDISLQEKKLPENKSTIRVEKKIDQQAEPSLSVAVKQRMRDNRQNRKILYVAPPTVIHTPVQEIITQDPPVDTVSKQVELIAELPAKKIKVVHINEIVTNESITEIAENNNRSNIRVNERDSDNFPKSLVISRSSDNLIKIKLPSN